MVHPKLFSTAFDDYKTREQIGQGGTGFVVSADPAGGGAPVAVKYLNKEVAGRKHGSRPRFRNEILFGTQAQHANVVRIIGHGVVQVGGESTLFYVMPLYELTLRKLMKQGIEPNKALPIFMQILQGVDAAHLSRVWHRDLKPENVLLTATATPEAVVADFGIAHFSDLDLYEATRTQHADRLANHRYCAPEQRDPGHECDHRADIYALGLMLNELFTGTVPAGTQYREVRSAAPDYAYLDPIIARAIRAQPSERFASVAELRSSISHHSQLADTQQRLDAATRKVAPDTEPDDPILQDPIRIMDNIDWRAGRLYLTLSGKPTDLWKQLFRQQRVSMYLNNAPSLAEWKGGRSYPMTFSVPATEQNVQAVLTQYHNHVADVNTHYAHEVRQHYAQQKHEEKRVRREQIAAEEARQRVLRSVRPDTT